MRRTGTRVMVAALVLAAGASFSLAADGRAFNPTAAVGSAVRLQSGDAALLKAAAGAPVIYVTQPGVLELQGEMIVRPWTREALAGRGLKAEEIEARVSRSRDRLADMEIQFVELFNHVIIRLPGGVDENQMAAFLMATGDYEYAEPNWICYPTLVPNDPQYNNAGHYTTRITLAEPAWNVTTGNVNIIAAVTDTGIRLDHEEFVGRRVPGANSATGTAIPEVNGGQVNDINGHGTHCMGSVGATGNNGVGMAGMNWQSKLMMVRVSNSTGGSSSLAALQAGATWAAQNGASVVSTSYSGVANSSNNTVGGTLRTLYSSLWFWAAGNSNANLGADNYPNLIIVMATTNTDAKASFSNFGAAVDIGAPGASIYSTYHQSSSSYNTLSGTSMACPAAAGCTSLIYSVNPAFTAATVEQILFNNADDLGTPGRDTTFGWGRINVGRSVADAYRRSYPINTLPFFDNFDSGADFTVSKWVYADTGTSASTGGVGEPSGARSMNVTFNYRVESNAINLAGNSGNVRLTFASQHRGPANGEQLHVEYLTNTDTWANLLTLTSNGTNQNSYVPQDVAIPNTAAARHAKFAIRFRAAGNAATDNWFIDDVRVGLPGCPADFNGDGQVDFFDYLDFVQAFSNGSMSADFNGDGQVDFFDYLDFVQAYSNGC